MNSDLLLPLELLSPGEWADVAEVMGDPVWVARLAELGIQPGSRVRVLQPGSPCLLQVDGARLSLRGDLAMQILGRPVVLDELTNQAIPALEGIR